jgi:energy-converting hydrogenase Eha subunit H
VLFIFIVVVVLSTREEKILAAEKRKIEFRCSIVTVVNLFNIKRNWFLTKYCDPSVQRFYNMIEIR